MVGPDGWLLLQFLVLSCSNIRSFENNMRLTLIFSATFILDFSMFFFCIEDKQLCCLTNLRCVRVALYLYNNR